MMSTFPPSPVDVSARCRPIFDEYPAIRRAYLFGSVAEGTAGPASDLDIAIVGPKGTDRLTLTNLGFELFARLSAVFSSDKIDVVVLNATDSSELRHAIIEDGRVIYDRGDDLEAFERQIRHEYEDHRATLVRLGIR